jgi:ABC-type dipeptide/oligopeptide/nickel transport system permease component
MNRKFQLIAALIVLALLLFSLAPLLPQESVQAQAGRQAGGTKKKNPNASGETEEQKEEQKVDKSAPTSAIEERRL